MFCVKMLLGWGGSTWNSFPLCLRIVTWSAVEPADFGTPSLFRVVVLSTAPLASTQLVTTIAASTVAPDSPVFPPPPST